VGSLGTISYFINETSSTDLTIADYTHYQDYSVAFAFPKNQIILRNIIQKGLQSISKDERNKIFSRWTEINVKKEYDYSKLRSFFIIVGIILAVIILIFFISNKILRKEINQRKSIEEELSKTLDKVNKQNDDKTILLQEIHHRVKNNLQIIISLLRLQANTHTNQEVKEALQEAIERVNSISMVHEHIYKNPNLAEIDLTAYIQNLGEELKRIFIKDKEIHINIQCNDTQLDIRPIIPLALILNELFTNSLKYAFSEQNSGSIDIDLKIQNDKLIMIYKDSGKWFNNIYTRNFGTYLIEIFTDQLNGSFNRENEIGTKYIFEFKDYN
ncbi:MAG: histidine kinase dimerization/phosphoacceptor domain -containing protein, partial [Flavobacteriia bacterium]